ncbi:hypothetical protein QUA00_28615 [Microcoleus sp. T2B6]|uniref:hypothetical protein n=1 Tax=Microcoleus sp. T2B6 TaxID=3055424 RepID=UPI002FD3A888
MKDRSPFVFSDDRSPKIKERSHETNAAIICCQLHYGSVSGIFPPTATNPTPQRVAASAKRLSRVAIGNSNRRAKLFGI